MEQLADFDVYMGENNLSFNNLLSGAEVTNSDFVKIIATAEHMKLNPEEYKNALTDKIIALVFDKPSLRTRFSFSAAITEMGEIL